jgi:hypothetical protein
VTAQRRVREDDSMKDEPRPDPKILDALEACRPYRDDLADPVMAEAAAELANNAELDAFARRLERLDARVADAFHDVPVPDGLAERIQRRLAEAQAASPPQPCPEAEQDFASEPIATIADQGPRVSRRWLMVGAAGITAAAAMLTAALIHLGRPDVDRPPMLEVAMQFFENDWDDTARSKPIADVHPDRDYPLSPYVLQGEWVRWRSVSEFLGRRGAAYELTRPGGPRATLYVVKYPLVGLPSQPSLEPALSTHNRSTSAWQSNSVLYVLVVEGGPRTYRSFLNLPSGPLT